MLLESFLVHRIASFYELLKFVLLLSCWEYDGNVLQNVIYWLITLVNFSDAKLNHVTLSGSVIGLFICQIASSVLSIDAVACVAAYFIVMCV